MFAAVLLIIGTAANDAGGLDQIWEIAQQGQPNLIGITFTFLN